MPVIELTPGRAGWQGLVDHLNACGQAKWVLDEDGNPKEECLYFLGVQVSETIAGSLTLKKQEIVIPHTEWADDYDRLMKGKGGLPLYETFVQTFFIDEDHRRRGHGEALQLAALEKTRALGCYQMRSWSSLDKDANYHLKLKLGFGFHPEVQVTSSGLAVSGGYFVRAVQ
ncbi:MAG: GNAT family N-acetyltransferase [Anaerolineales bacterium]|jgi:GNAT superfamily N-acetyltransferase